jgi:hypothetical protein
MNLQQPIPAKLIPAIPANDLTTAEHDAIAERMRQYAVRIAIIEQMRQTEWI